MGIFMYVKIDQNLISQEDKTLFLYIFVSVSQIFFSGDGVLCIAYVIKVAAILLKKQFLSPVPYQKN